MTHDTMCTRISKFVQNVKNIAFTDEKGMPWFGVHSFSENVLITNRNNAYQILYAVMHGDFQDEIKAFTQYVKCRVPVVKLFDEGGTGFTPVMTVVGLLAFTMRVPHSEVAKHVRDLATQSLSNLIIGDENHIKLARENAAMSEPIQQLLRQARDQQRASGGASIAEPFAQVLSARMMCCCCNCSDFDLSCRARLRWR